MAKVFIAEVVLKLIDNMTGPMQRTSRQVQQHTNLMTAEFKKLERGVGSFIGAFAGIGVVTREMSRLTEVMKEYSRTQQQILSLNVRPDPRPGGGGRLMGDMGSTEYLVERRKLDQRALELSKRYNVAPSAVLDEIMALKQAGISLAGSRLAAGPLVALARVTGIKDTNELTRQVVGAATEFRLPMSTVPRPGQKVADIESSTLRMANIMLYLRSKNVTPQEMLEATKYAGSISATVGGTPESFAATLAGLAERQVSGTMAGTVLRSDVNRLLQMTEGKFKSGAKALEKYGGISKFVTEVPVTGARLKAAMETQFGLEAGGTEPTAAEWDRLAKMTPIAREEAMRGIAEKMAPQSYFQALQASPDMITRQLELANLQAGKFVNLTGVWKDGKWIPGVAETIGGDLGTMGQVFEGRHLGRNIALAQSAPMIREMLKRGRGGIPEDLMEEALKIINDINSWEAAFSKLQYSIERAFVRFSGSAVGKAILRWIDTLSDWIEDLSTRFEKMPAGEQWKFFSSALTGFMLFVGDLIKIMGDILSGDALGALTHITALGAKLTAGAAAWDATGKMGGSPGDQMVAAVAGAFGAQIIGDILGKVGSFFGLKDIGSFAGTLIGAGGITAGSVMLPKLWDYTKKIFHPTVAGPPDLVGDALAGAGIDPNKAIDVSKMVESTGGGFLAWLLGAKAAPRSPNAGPNFPSPFDNPAFKYYGYSTGDVKQPGYIPPASFDESRLEKHDKMLADMIDKNAVEVSAGLKNLPPELKTAFLQALQEWSTGNPGMAAGGVGGFGFGIGGTQLGGFGGSKGGAWGGGSIGGSFITGDPLIDTLFKGEGTGGNYNAVLGHGGGLPGVDLTKMSLSQVLALSAQIKARYHSSAGPMGAFQIVGNTLRRHAAALGMDLDNTLFTPETQQKLFRHILATEGPGAWAGFHGRRFSREQVLHALHYVFGSAAGGVGGGEMSALGGNLGMRGVDPRLAMIAGAAAGDLGLQIRATSGFRHGDHGFHGRGLAQDFQLYLNGQPIPNRGNDFSGWYQRWARQMYARQEAMFPGMSFNWGGAHGTQKGYVNDEADLMHVDEGPDRGHLARNRRAALEARIQAAPFRQTRLDVHIHDDGIRMSAKGNQPIRANYRGRRMAETGGGFGFGTQWWKGN